MALSLDSLLSINLIIIYNHLISLFDNKPILNPNRFGFLLVSPKGFFFIKNRPALVYILINYLITYLFLGRSLIHLKQNISYNYGIY